MEFFEAISAKFNYWIYVIIMMIGLYAMIAKNNMVKKLIGMSIFQTAIILFYVSIGVKDGATIPILYHDQVHAGHHHDDHGDDAHHGSTDHHDTSHGGDHETDEFGYPTRHAPDVHIDGDGFANPLVHVLMLTAIVVGVSTLGVGLAITQKLHREFGTIEENEIHDLIKSGK
ncbi:MAG TPA: NADH-quinone oxidoreductase subunit J [Opitutae bacterium]|nr:NADH-quinone oxidoreductase subunit J [Opitutaceae bacterium]HCR30050.1 NADH-quinone oxidoreductase subunit J [Opitutae bacterium]